MDDKARKKELMEEYEALTGKRVPNQNIEWFEQHIAELKAGEGSEPKENDDDGSEKQVSMDYVYELEQTIIDLRDEIERLKADSRIEKTEEGEPEKVEETIIIRNISESPVSMLGFELKAGEEKELSEKLANNAMFMKKVNHGIKIKTLIRV